MWSYVFKSFGIRCLFCSAVNTLNVWFIYAAFSISICLFSQESRFKLGSLPYIFGKHHVNLTSELVMSLPTASSANSIPICTPSVQDITSSRVLEIRKLKELHKVSSDMISAFWSRTAFTHSKNHFVIICWTH